MNLAKRIFAGILALSLSAGPVLAQSFDPNGMWEATDGESRYEVSLCGDGTQLCAKLVWIRPDVTNERNSQYLNTYVVQNAKRHNDREWRGTINLYGVSVNGSVKRLSDDVMQVRGCAVLILCERKVVTRMPAEVAQAD